MFEYQRNSGETLQLVLPLGTKLGTGFNASSNIVEFLPYLKR
jgi:hypothetical protein